MSIQWGETPDHVLYGNVSQVEDATLFCYPMDHQSKEHDKLAQCYLEKYYREGDIILVEGTATSKPYFPQNGYHYECISWEPESRKDYFERLPILANRVNTFHEKITDTALSHEESRDKLIEIVEYLLIEQIDLIRDETIQNNTVNFLEHLTSYLRAFDSEPDQTDLIQAFNILIPSIKQCSSRNEKLGRDAFFLMSTDLRKDFNTFPLEDIKEIYRDLGSVIFNLYLAAETEASMEERDLSHDEKMNQHLTALKIDQRLHDFGGGLHFRPTFFSTPPCYKTLTSHPRTVMVLPLSDHFPYQRLDTTKSIQSFAKCGFTFDLNSNR